MIKYQIDSNLKLKKPEDLLDLPQTILVNKFDESSAKEFRDSFAKALNTGQKIVPIVIDSYGGHVYSLLSMVGVIKNSPVPVATIVSGKAMSCGAVLFTCGSEGYRFMDPHSTLLIHDVSAGSFGKVEEIKASATEIERLNQIIYKLMSTNIGKPEDYFLKLIHEKGHADYFLDANECKNHNLANYLRIPSFKVSISTAVEFM